MSPMDDPLRMNLLKLATVCLNSESKFVYQCYHCNGSFARISDTLCHVESHFDAKVDIFKHLLLAEAVGSSVSETNDKIKAHPSIDYGEALIDEIKVEPIIEIELIGQTIKTEEEENKEYETESVFAEVASSGPPIQCRLCEEIFTAPSTLIIHLMKSHSNATKFKCPMCYESYVHEWMFLNHLYIGHIQSNETSYDALIDRIISTCDVKSTVHTISTAVKRPFTKYQMRFLKTCDICSEQFSNTKHIRSHMRRVHVRRRLFDGEDRKHNTKYVLDCDKCNIQFFRKSDFYAHQYGHLTYEHRVNDIDKEVLKQKLLDFVDANIFHDESSPDKPMFQCKLCSIAPSQIRKSAEYHILQRHIYYVRRNRSLEDLTCDQCKKTFANVSNLNYHKKILHATTKQSVHCPVCNKCFPHKRNLRSHMSVHSEMRSYQCPECGKSFKLLHQMRKHCHTHSGETLKCPICHRELKKHRLKQHMRDVHENETRPYSCPVCSLAFKTRKTLVNHSYRHTGERKFQCRYNSISQCTEKFNTSAARRAHERSKHERL